MKLFFVVDCNGKFKQRTKSGGVTYNTAGSANQVASYLNNPKRRDAWGKRDPYAGLRPFKVMRSDIMLEDM